MGLSRLAVSAIEGEEFVHHLGRGTEVPAEVGSLGKGAGPDPTWSAVFSPQESVFEFLVGFALEVSGHLCAEALQGRVFFRGEGTEAVFVRECGLEKRRVTGREHGIFPGSFIVCKEPEGGGLIGRDGIIESLGSFVERAYGVFKEPQFIQEPAVVLEGWPIVTEMPPAAEKGIVQGGVVFTEAADVSGNAGDL